MKLGKAWVEEQLVWGYNLSKTRKKEYWDSNVKLKLERAGMFTHEKDLGGIRISANAKVYVTDLGLIQLLDQEKRKNQKIESSINHYYGKRFHQNTEPYEGVVSN